MLAIAPSQTPDIQRVDLNQLINHALKIHFEFQWKSKQAITGLCEQAITGQVCVNPFNLSGPITEIKTERSGNTLF